MTKILRKLLKMGRKMEEKCWNDIIWIIRIWKKKKGLYWGKRRDKKDVQ